MGDFKLSKKSESNMMGLHPDLIVLAKEAIKITPYDFGINSSTVRTKEQQEIFVAEGKSKTMSSRHVPSNNECLLSCALDFNVYVNGKITWDIKYFRPVAQAFVTTAIKYGIPIELGILWRTFIDGPHCQLSRETYP